MPGDEWNKAANLRALLAYMWAHPGKQLLFMGSELGQEREWSESRSLDWGTLENPLHAGIQDLVGDLNRTYRSQPALYTQDSSPDGFAWIDANDAGGNVFSFLRWGSDGSVVACVANFAGHPHENYRVGLPFAGQWHEIVNTDASAYGGSGVGNLGSVVATEEPWHGRPASASLRIPPSGVLWLRGEPAPAAPAVPELAAAEPAAVGRAAADPAAPGSAAPDSTVASGPAGSEPAAGAAPAPSTGAANGLAG
jgi:1,4-alpha-glucan branching enzyme